MSIDLSCVVTHLTKPSLRCLHLPAQGAQRTRLSHLRAFHNTAIINAQRPSRPAIWNPKLSNKAQMPPKSVKKAKQQPEPNSSSSLPEKKNARPSTSMTAADVAPVDQMKVVASGERALPQSTTEPSAIAAYKFPSTRPSAGMRRGELSSYVSNLLASGKPVVIYAAGPQLRYIITSYASATGLLLISSWTLKTYLTYATSALVLGAGVVSTACFATLGLYLGYAPAKMIGRITLVPALPRTGHMSLSRMATLNIEFLQVLPKFNLSPAEAPLSSVTSDRSIADFISMQRRHRASNQSTSRFGGAFSDKIRRVYWDILRMFFRSASMAHIRLPDLKGSWKLDVSNAYLLDDGKALDHLLEVDPVRHSWHRSLLI